MNSENASERLYSKFESVGTPAHMNVQGPNDELEPGCLARRLRRNVWQAVESDCLTSRVTRCSVCLKAECTSCHIANLTLDVSSASYLCDVHNDAVCSDRGQRLLSDQGSEM